jgi:hypothetical protein
MSFCTPKGIAYCRAFILIAQALAPTLAGYVFDWIQVGALELQNRQPLFETLGAGGVLRLTASGTRPLVPILTTEAVTMATAQPARIQANRTVWPACLNQGRPTGQGSLF